MWLYQVNGNQVDEVRPDLADADMVVFLGDFNYRLYGISYDEARDMVSQRSFDWLREKDQLRAEMKAGKVFQGMREGLIKFPPTYKFQKGAPGLGGMSILIIEAFDQLLSVQQVKYLATA